MRIVLHRDNFSDERAGDAGFAHLSSLGFDAAPTLVAFRNDVTSVVEVELEDDSNFEGELLIGDEAISFEVRGMMNADEMHVRFVSATHVEANVEVAAGDRPAQPRPRCSDGTEGYPCVTCKKGTGTIRICC